MYVRRQIPPRLHETQGGLRRRQATARPACKCVGRRGVTRAIRGSNSNSIRHAIVAEDEEGSDEDGLRPHPNPNPDPDPNHRVIARERARPTRRRSKKRTSRHAAPPRGRRRASTRRHRAVSPPQPRPLSVTRRPPRCRGCCSPCSRRCSPCSRGERSLEPFSTYIYLNFSAGRPTHL